MPRTMKAEIARSAAAIALAVSAGVTAPAAMAQDGRTSSPCAPKTKKAAPCGPSRPCGPKAKKAAPCGPSAPCAPRKKDQ